MNATTTHQAGGINFNFAIYAGTNRNWPAGAGLYVMCRQNPASGEFNALYVGQCGDFTERLCSHERWGEAALRGMTHVLVTRVTSQPERDRLEEILIKDLNPPMNLQLRTQSTGWGFNARR